MRRSFCAAFALAVLTTVLCATPAHAQRSRQAARARAAQRSSRARHAGAEPPSPASVLGFTPGTERRLVEWDTIVRYFRALAASSNRVQVRELGKTTNGAPFIVAYISSPANLARLSALRTAQARLADPRMLTDSAAAARLLEQTPTFVLITAGVHSTEVGANLSPLDIAWRLASAPSAEERMILDRTVVVLVPSMNPDGVTIVARWYQQTLGTPAEGSGPPELYHHYVGHDDNRDWYAFSQVETQLVVDSLYGVWHPQVTMDIHQQGQNGARLFLPPYMDPVEPNVDPIIVQGVNALGLDIARRLTTDGFPGISVNSTYDAWTPGRAFQHYHGAVRILQETASASLATSVTLNGDSLRPGLGVDPRTTSWSFVEKWPGGRWTLADIVRYQTAAAMAMLGQVARSAEQWRRSSFLVLQRASRGWDGWPWGFVIPTNGQDPIALGTLLDIMHHAQVEVRQILQPVTLGGVRYSPGTYVVVLRQPFAAFAKAVFERQNYPDLREYPGGPPKRPYDVTAHTLPLLLGVRVLAVAESLGVGLSAPVTVNPPVPRVPGLSADRAHAVVRLGLYKSWQPSMDEGWTRWIFDTWGIPYESLTDSIVRAAGLSEHYDAIILPDQSVRELMEGLPARRYPARLAGGLGPPGMQALRDFVDNGGTLIAFNNASDFAIGALELPVTDVLVGLPPREFYAPGSIFRMRLDLQSPLTQGMDEESIAWFEGGGAFDVRDPTRVRVIGRYPENPSDVLLSGWVLGANLVAGKAAVVEVKRGRGRVILFGFRPQYRGQSQATYPLVFNAIKTSAQNR
ncbi:MAG: M14 family zinc carboxypeptidase [Gemmatimonadales bacterium]